MHFWNRHKVQMMNRFPDDLEMKWYIHLPSIPEQKWSTRSSGLVDKHLCLYIVGGPIVPSRAFSSNGFLSEHAVPYSGQPTFLLT